MEDRLFFNIVVDFEICSKWLQVNRFVDGNTIFLNSFYSVLFSKLFIIAITSSSPNPSCWAF